MSGIFNPTAPLNLVPSSTPPAALLAVGFALIGLASAKLLESTTAGPEVFNVPAGDINTPTSAPSASATAAVGLDSSGCPWDARIHAGTQSKTKDGKWTRGKGVTTEQYDAIAATIRQAVPAAPAPSAIAPASIPAPPVAAGAPMTYEQLMAMAAPAAQAQPPRDYGREAMTKATEAIQSGRIVPTQVLALIAELGLQSPNDFQQRPDLLPAFYARLGIAA